MHHWKCYDKLYSSFVPPIIPSMLGLVTANTQLWNSQLPVTDQRVQQEWIDIRAEVAFHKETSVIRHPSMQSQSTSDYIKLEILSWADCFKRGCWRRTHIGMGLMFFQVRLLFDWEYQLKANDYPAICWNQRSCRSFFGLLLFRLVLSMSRFKYFWSL